MNIVKYIAPLIFLFNLFYGCKSEISDSSEPSVEEVHLACVGIKQDNTAYAVFLDKANNQYIGVLGGHVFSENVELTYISYKSIEVRGISPEGFNYYFHAVSNCGSVNGNNEANEHDIEIIDCLKNNKAKYCLDKYSNYTLSQDVPASDVITIKLPLKGVNQDDVYYNVVALEKWLNLDVCKSICNEGLDIYNSHFIRYLDLLDDNNCHCIIEVINNESRAKPDNKMKADLLYYKLKYGIIKKPDDISSLITNDAYKYQILAGLQSNYNNTFNKVVEGYLNDDDGTIRFEALRLYNCYSQSKEKHIINVNALQDTDEGVVNFALNYLIKTGYSLNNSQIERFKSKMMKTNNVITSSLFIELISNGDSKNELRSILTEYNIDCNTLIGNAINLCRENEGLK